MSTGKTTRLALNQWVLDDPFLMEEMNEDNRKIDENAQRLQALIDSMPYVKLMDVTTTSEVQQVDLNLSGIDLSKFIELKIFTSICGNRNDGNASYGGNYCMKINPNAYMRFAISMYNKNEQGASQTVDVRGYRTNQNPNIVQYSLFGLFSNDPSKQVTLGMKQHAAASWTLDWYHYAVDVAKINSLSFLPSAVTSYLSAGSRFTVYGVKL